MQHALQFLVFTFAGWLNRHQEDLIDYLREENRVLREQLGDQPLRLTDAQRRRLALRGERLGRWALAQVASIVTPDTILRWYRRLIARKYDGSARRGRGRPMTPRELAELVVRMAVENPTWGYTRIRDALANLGHQIARNTVKRILQDHGIEPAHERRRRTPWKTFLEAHWQGLTAANLFTVEVPHTYAFLEILKSSGIQSVKLPPRSPNLNAYAERFVRSIKEECLSRVILLGEGRLHLVVHEYVEHYHRERNHQGLHNQLLERAPPPENLAAEVHRRGRIGGLLNYYHREAA